MAISAAIGPILSSFGRAAAAGGMRAGMGAAVSTAKEGARAGVRSAVRSAVVRKKKTRPDRESTPVTEASGGGGGSMGGGGGRGTIPITSAIVPAPKSESSVVASSSASMSIKDELTGIRSTLEQILQLEVEEKSKLEDAILDKVKEDEKNRRTEEQERLESGKTKRKQKDNPIVSGAKKAVKGIFGMIMDMVGFFIKYKVLEWLGKEENREKVKRLVEFFSGLFKFIAAFTDKVLLPFLAFSFENFLNMLNTFGAIITSIVDFFTFKWFTNPKEFIENLFNVPKQMLKTVTHFLGGLLNFLTFGLFNQGEEQADKEIDNTDFDKEGEKLGEEKLPQEDTKKEEGKNPVQQVGDAIGGALGMLNPLNWFGGGDKKEETSREDLPQLKEGGIVGPEQSSGDGETKPTVKPLSEMMGLTGLAEKLSSGIKSFLDLMIAPFKVVGTALVAIALKTISIIPGIGMLLKPIIMMMGTAFGVPKEVLSILDTKTTSKELKEKEEEEEKEEKEKEKESSEDSKSGGGDDKSGDDGTSNEDSGGGFDFGKLLINPLGAAADFVGGIVPGPVGDAIKATGNVAGALFNPAGTAIGLVANFAKNQGLQTLKSVGGAAMSATLDGIGKVAGALLTSPAAAATLPPTTGMFGQDSGPPGATPAPGSGGNLASAAESLRGMSSASGPDGGQNGCVWAVNQVYAKAGMTPPWGNSLYVPTAEADMVKAGYTQVSSADRQPGDIMVMYDNQSPPQAHIGVVLQNGNVLSNSSGKASLSWEDSPEGYNSYYGNTGKIYRMPNSASSPDIAQKDSPVPTQANIQSTTTQSTNTTGATLLKTQQESNALESQASAPVTPPALIQQDSQNTSVDNVMSSGGDLGNNFPMSGPWATYKTKL